jgi:hypothetical protein
MRDRPSGGRQKRDADGRPEFDDQAIRIRKLGRRELDGPCFEVKHNPRDTGLRFGNSNLL